jgi:hypothetical protein
MDGLVADLLQAAKRFAASLAPGVNLGLISFAGNVNVLVSMGLVSFGATATMLLAPTTDRSAMKSAIDSCAAANRLGSTSVARMDCDTSTTSMMTARFRGTNVLGRTGQCHR